MKMVEAAGVEPASENTPLQASTYLVLIIVYRASVSPGPKDFQRYPAIVSQHDGSRIMKLFQVVDVLSNLLGNRKEGR